MPTALRRLAAKQVEGIDRWKLAGLAFVFLWFFVGGIAHFVATAAEMRVVLPTCHGPAGCRPRRRR